jgi:hypothetical protein
MMELNFQIIKQNQKPKMAKTPIPSESLVIQLQALS